MVLLKEATSHGFVFYTNTQSPKGEQLHHSPWAELCFYWNPPGRQVRVHGRVESVSEAEADHYFASRPYRSQVGAWASQQSRPLASQAKLMAEAATTALKYAQRVPRPPHWSGFRVVPDWIEFWEERAYRLHDRVRYSRSDDGTWADQRLYP
jgi:pyridoxamine 5'-phosphate oxidase